MNTTSTTNGNGTVAAASGVKLNEGSKRRPSEFRRRFADAADAHRHAVRQTEKAILMVNYIVNSRGGTLPLDGYYRRLLRLLTDAHAHLEIIPDNVNAAIAATDLAVTSLGQETKTTR